MENKIKDEKIKYFILYDEGAKDKFEFADFIEFRKEVSKKRLNAVIQNIKSKDDYNNEEIYKELKKNFGKFTLTYINEEFTHWIGY